MSKKVFLSYAHQDRAIAQRAATLLKKHGHMDTDDMSFIDPQADSELGGDVREAIKRQIVARVTWLLSPRRTVPNHHG